MFGEKDGRAKRAMKEAKMLERRAKRTGRQLEGADKARNQRLNGLASKLAYQEAMESD